MTLAIAGDWTGLDASWTLPRIWQMGGYVDGGDVRSRVWAVAQVLTFPVVAIGDFGRHLAVAVISIPVAMFRGVCSARTIYDSALHVVRALAYLSTAVITTVTIPLSLIFPRVVSVWAVEKLSLAVLWEDTVKQSEVVLSRTAKRGGNKLHVPPRRLVLGNRVGALEETSPEQEEVLPESVSRCKLGARIIGGSAFACWGMASLFGRKEVVYPNQDTNSSRLEINMTKVKGMYWTCLDGFRFDRIMPDGTLGPVIDFPDTKPIMQKQRLVPVLSKDAWNEVVAYWKRPFYTISEKYARTIIPPFSYTPMQQHPLLMLEAVTDPWYRVTQDFFLSDEYIDSPYKIGAAVVLTGVVAVVAAIVAYQGLKCLGFCGRQKRRKSPKPPVTPPSTPTSSVEVSPTASSLACKRLPEKLYSVLTEDDIDSAIEEAITAERPVEGREDIPLYKEGLVEKIRPGIKERLKSWWTHGPATSVSWAHIVAQTRAFVKEAIESVQKVNEPASSRRERKSSKSNRKKSSRPQIAFSSPSFEPEGWTRGFYNGVSIFYPFQERYTPPSCIQLPPGLVWGMLPNGLPFAYQTRGAVDVSPVYSSSPSMALISASSPTSSSIPVSSSSTALVRGSALPISSPMPSFESGFGGISPFAQYPFTPPYENISSLGRSSLLEPSSSDTSGRKGKAKSKRSSSHRKKSHGEQATEPTIEPQHPPAEENSVPVAIAEEMSLPPPSPPTPPPPEASPPQTLPQPGSDDEQEGEGHCVIS